MSGFPTLLSNVQDGATDIIAAHINNLEAKVGIDNSTVPTSLDYRVKQLEIYKTANALTKPTINGSVQGSNSYSPAAGATATLDCAADNVHKIQMPAGNATIAVTNVTVGQFFKVDITQDSVGGRTVTWFGGIKWADGIAPILTTTANKRDSFVFECTGSNTYDGFVVGQNI